MAATFNTDEHKIFNNFTYVICGDGCLQEGVSSETSSLAGHLGLGKLIVLYDDNDITIDGSTDLSFTEDVVMRYNAYGWHTQTVGDVADGISDLRTAIANAKVENERPSIIKIKTAIGFGSPSKQGLASAHGAPLGLDDLAGAKTFYGLDPSKSFHVDADVQAEFSMATLAGENKKTEWETMFAEYSKAHPDKAAELNRRFGHELPAGIMDKLPKFTVGEDKDLATRKFSEDCINSVALDMQELVGGSADLTPSNLTNIKSSGDFQKDTPQGRYFRFGVREHGMSSICNGVFAYGGLRPYCATFLNFIGYAMGAVRLSALSKFGVIYVMTHDSIGLGEDGPTHQPVESLESLRCMPNINVCRPADSNETSASYQIGLASSKTPTVICCSRSTVKGLAGSTVEKALKGAYAAIESESPALIIIATGSEVGPCVDAAKGLEEVGIATRVVSMPCQEFFLQQSVEYQKSILPGDVPTLSVEASAVNGWHRFAHAHIGMTQFGRSGNGGDVFKFFGFTKENVASKGQQLVEFYKGSTVPDLMNRPVFKSDQDDGH
jgi:transketolase